ncbi:MAG: hypothetical protein ABI591_09500 [Kofleriaceae bacterium]
MRSLIDRFRRDSGLALLGLALVAAVALYAPSLGRGLVNYDDPVLYTDNALLHHPSWGGLITVLTDLDSPQRYALSPEYLPVRDLSVMADYAIWGEHYGGFHLTNLAIYLVAIVLWFYALASLGVPRPIAGLAMLLWAVHPSHAESVAWLAERKGLLGVMLAGVCALGYARFRSGGRAAWLVLAVVTGVAAVWSKAIAAFAIAALGPLELVASARTSWRRSLTGLGAIAVAAGLAFVPVVLLAVRWSIVGGGSAALPASRIASVLGVHGFYLRLAAGAMPNAVSYPIASTGPGALDLVLGAVGFVVIAVALWRGSRALKVAAVLWIFGWLPVGHLVLPLQMVFVADRYLLIPTLGLALALAVGISQITRPKLRAVALVVVALAFAFRALDAQSTWRSSALLWERAIASNPSDGNAWAMYVEELDSEGRVADAAVVIEAALSHSRAPRLVMHAGLNALAEGRTDKAFALMTEAASRAEPRAAANLANMLVGRNRLGEALVWARFAVLVAPMYANGYRIQGKVARLIDQHSVESLGAFQRAYALEPNNAANRYNLGIALADAGRTAEARTLLDSCLADPAVGRAARLALDHL